MIYSQVILVNVIKEPELLEFNDITIAYILQFHSSLNFL